MPKKQKNAKIKFSFPFQYIPQILSSFPFYLGTFFLLSYILLSNVITYQAINQNYVEVLKKPLDPVPHIKLAGILLENGKINPAFKEINISQFLYDKSNKKPVTNSQFPNILGSSASPMEIWKNWKTEPILLERKYNYWTNLISQKQDFRDAYLAASYYAYLTGRQNEAKSILEKAKKLDPNYQVISVLLQEISSVN